jgi:membrane-bound lytic murein transglycosylase MltF
MSLFKAYSNIIVVSLLACIGGLPGANSNAMASSKQDSVQNRINQPFIGDLKQIRERRILRVLVSYNRTNFFHTIKGDRGIEHDLMKEFEKYLNRGPRKERYKTHIVFLARPFERLISDLTFGYGDIAASGLTITPERSALVDFTDPYIKNVKEILVSHSFANPPKTFEELSGKQVIVVANSSYIIHLEKINQQLGRLGLAGIEIIKADPLLDSEDLLEMVNAGLFEYTVVDNHIAEIYQNIYPKIRLQNDFIIHEGGQIAWAINQNLPELKKSLNNFIRNYARPGKFLGNSLYKKYFKNPYWIKQNLSLTALDETPCLQYYFEKYATFFEFDWYLIAAQAFQESGFNQNAKSRVNAVGIMQVRPSTARSKVVNIPDIYDLENNILAGVKYLAFIRDFYFTKPEYSEADRLNFTLAAYNAGPGRIRQLQRWAEKRGFDPHKWHYNVEVIAREEIGQETVDYVTNIQKTQIALKLSKELAMKKYRLKQKKLLELEQQRLRELEESQQLNIKMRPILFDLKNNPIE